MRTTRSGRPRSHFARSRFAPSLTLVGVLLALPLTGGPTAREALAQDDAVEVEGGDDFSLDPELGAENEFGSPPGSPDLDSPTGDMNLGNGAGNAANANSTGKAANGGNTAAAGNAGNGARKREAKANAAPAEAVPGLGSAMEGGDAPAGGDAPPSNDAARENVLPADPASAVVGQDPALEQGALPNEAYPFASGEADEKPFRPEDVPPPPEPPRPKRPGDAPPMANTDGGVPENAAPATDPSRGGANAVSGNAVPGNAAPGNATAAQQENLPLPPPIGEAGTLRYATPPNARGAMSEQEMALFRDIAGKLKALPLGTGPEEYVVQPGDTLWDISDQLLDDPFWWPRLWTLNEEQIENPNLIYPGMVLVFHPSDGEAAPVIAARDEEFLKPVSIESARTIDASNPLAAKWKGKDGHLLDPNELPRDPTVFQVGDFNPSVKYAFRIPGFMSRSDIDEVARIRKLATSHAVAIVGTLAFADFDSMPKVGERYLVLREMPEPRDPDGNVEDIPLWSYVAAVGVVNINKSGVVSLLVEQGPMGVMEDDIVVPFRNLLVQVNPGVETKKSRLRTHVVGVLDDNVLLASEAQAVFLEKNGPAAVGEEIDLYMPPGGIVMFSDDEDELDYVRVGTARIVEVGDDTVTAVVLGNTSEVSVGARTYARD